MTQVQTNAIANAIAAAVAAAMNGGKAPRKPRSDRGFTKQAVADAMTVDQKREALNTATIAAFAKAGFGAVTPRVDVLVYGKPASDDKPATGWIAKGMKPKAGSKAVFVKAKGMRGKGIPLFHVSQCEPIATEQSQSAA